VRDLLANLLGRLQATNRQQRLYLALGAVVVLFVARFGIGWFLEYREGVKEEIQLTAQRLAGARRLLERAPESQKQLDRLRERYRTTVAGLVPGESPTLAAAQLQERVSDLAAEKNVQIQTMQILKDEPLGPFRQVSLRVTASGDLRNVADLLASLEYGDLRVSIPFIELSRRGAAIRRTSPQVQVSRLVSATLQIAGVIRSSAEAEAGGGVQKVAAEGDQGAGPPAAPAEPGAPAASASAPAEAPAPSRAAAPPVPVPEVEAAREPIPEDPLGTAGQVSPP
jgi:hypothetical protein